MRNQPLLVAIVIGIFVIFVIVGVSLAVKLSNVSRLWKEESVKNIQMGKENAQLKEKIATLEKDKVKLENEKKALEELVKELKDEAAACNLEIEKLKKINDILEDKIKEELIQEDKKKE